MQLHGFAQTAAPATDLVVTVAAAKLALRVDGTDLDTELERLIRSATRQAEAELRRALLTQTWALTLDAFPAHGCIQLPYGASAVSAVEYVDDAGATQTLAGTQYVVDVTRAPGRLWRADGVTWPTTARRPAAVTITLDCGFGDVADVPEDLKDWILAHVGARLRNPEAFAQGVSVNPLPNRFIDSLLDQWRLTVL